MSASHVHTQSEDRYSRRHQDLVGRLVIIPDGQMVLLLANQFTPIRRLDVRPLGVEAVSVADQFRRAKKHLPQTTEAERLAIQRVGQDLYRSALMDYWQGRCCVTGLAVPALLRASHIKPWAKCQSDDERLDVFNGFLLAPHVDALFDGGWISFSDQGGLLVSEALPYAARVQLGVSSEWNIPSLKPEHASYLTFHRANEFR